MDNLIVWLLPLFGVIGLAYMLYLAKWVKEQDAGNDRMKQILTEKNSPSPVMLGDSWSEWSPV